MVNKPTMANKAKDSHPSYEDMLIECINEANDRAGVSRSTLKKFLSNNYKIDPESKTTSNNISRSVKKGIDNKIFVCPKGPTGKVKLAPATSAKKRSASDSSESDDDKVVSKTKRVAKKAPTRSVAKKAPAKVAAKAAQPTKVVTGKTASGRAITTTSHANQVKKNVVPAAKKTSSSTTRKVAEKKQPATKTLTNKKTDAKKPAARKARASQQAQKVKKPASAPAKKPVAVKAVDGNTVTNRRKSTRK